MKYFLVGIKGSGMSSLAKLLYDKGNHVTGVDIDERFYTERYLDSITIESFDNMNLRDDYIYIIGNAYIDHSVSKYIKNMNYESYTYPEFIAYYFKDYKFIAVSGSHGKTTTTKMISDILPDSSYIIGDGSGCGAGNSNFIIEACEYKNTFLNYYPDIALILNIDYDHPDFFKNYEEYYNSFLKFANQSKLVVCNGDFVNIKSDNVITYGFNEDNDIVFTIVNKEASMDIKVLDTIINIPLVGTHYAYDFVGAYIVSKLLDIHDDDIKNKMKLFKLPKRRMEQINIFNSLCFLDYAHHPTEIKSVYNTLKTKYSNKLVCVFQPHTITRTKAFIYKFKEALELYDEVYLLPIFTSVREHKDYEEERRLYSILGFKVISSINEIEFIKDNIYVFLGAGDIDKLVERK